MTSHSRVILLVGGIILSIGLGVGFYLNHRASSVQSAQNAFYLATKTLEGEQKKAVDSKADAKEKVTPQADAAALSGLNVDTDLKDSVAQFEQVYQNYSGTRAAYDSAMTLGDLYFNQGNYAQAASWYGKAAQGGLDRLEKALAFSSLGYAQENLGKSDSAVDSFQKALNMGEVSLKGDLLLSLARNQEARGDFEKAGKAYDQILTDLPGTETAKSAEILKSRTQQKPASKE